MQRVTERDLDNAVKRLNAITGGSCDFSISHANGGVRLERRGGSVDVSPRGTKAELWMWIHAFMDGIDLARKLAYEAEVARA